MKVYIIYACIPDNLWMTKMKNIDDDIRESELPKYYRTADNRYVGVYAYTKYKDVLNEFIYYRKDAWKCGLYRLKEKKMTKEEFSMFQSIYPTRELSVYPIFSNRSDGLATSPYPSFNDIPKRILKEDADIQSSIHVIVCTDHEYCYIEDMSDHCLLMYFVNTNPPDYSIFNNEYQNILDIIGYTIQFTDLIQSILWEYDEIDNLYINERFDDIDYNYSFNLSPLGNKYFSLSHSFLFMFMNVFYEMIFGYTETSKINMMGVV